ncbi:MAG: Copper amine oxidase N-terminal domain [Capsulimonas sp.]|nr:Copper amine oxidase N-terminal domain [Capsulimonas sp.]
MKSPARGVTAAAVALAAALSLSVIGPHRAYAAPIQGNSDSNLAVTILSPTPRTSFSGEKPVDISTFYQGSATNRITAVELFVDGVSVFTKHLDAPEERGVTSFLVDASHLTAGTHRIVIRAIAADAEVVSAKSSFIFVSDDQNPAPRIAAPTQATPNALPQLSYVSPATDDKLQGTVKIQLDATDPSGKEPYVTVFVDNVFKMVRNFPPYEYDWDTTTYPNGYHTIQSFGYNEADKLGPAKTMRVYVNNPGGRTAIRTDLKDGGDKQPTAPKTTDARPLDTRVTASAKPKSIAPMPVATQPLPRKKTSVRPAAPATLAQAAVKRAPVASKTLVAKSFDLQAPTGGSDLTSPFVPDVPAAPRVKASGLARRPQLPAVKKLSGPAIAAGETRRTQHEIMLAKREDLFDETGGASLGSQLSDPFLPETTTPRPKPATPVSGFKPKPAPDSAIAAQPVVKAPKVASAGKVTPMKIAPTVQIIHVNAGVAATAPAPYLAAPAVTAPKTVKPILTAPKTEKVVVAQPQAVKVAVAQPKAIKVVVTQAKITKTVIVQPKATKVIVAQPKAEKPILAQPHPLTQAKTAKLQLVETPIHVNMAAVQTSVPMVKKIIVHVPAPKHVRIHTGATSSTRSLLNAKGQTSVLFNSTVIRLDRPLAAHGNVLFSPFRQIFEYQGGKLTWESKTGTVRAVSGDKDISLKIGARTATVNDTKMVMPSAPYLAEGRTMVPMAFLSTAMDVNVQYDQATGHLLVTSK